MYPRKQLSYSPDKSFLIKYVFTNYYVSNLFYIKKRYFIALRPPFIRFSIKAEVEDEGEGEGEEQECESNREIRQICSLNVKSASAIGLGRVENKIYHLKSIRNLIDSNP